MGWLIAAVLLICLLLFILLTPLIIELNTESGKLEVRLYGLARVFLAMDDNRLLLRGKVLGYRFQSDLLNSGRQREKRIKEKTARSSPRFAAGTITRKGLAVLRSFRVRTFIADLDTDDFVLNGWLYPVFHFVDRSHRHLNVNFTGRNVVAVKLENNLLSLVWAILK